MSGEKSYSYRTVSPEEFQRVQEVIARAMREVRSAQRQVGAMAADVEISRWLSSGERSALQLLLQQAEALPRALTEQKANLITREAAEIYLRASGIVQRPTAVIKILKSLSSLKQRVSTLAPPDALASAAEDLKSGIERVQGAVKRDGARRAPSGQSITEVQGFTAIADWLEATVEELRKLDALTEKLARLDGVDGQAIRDESTARLEAFATAGYRGASPAISLAEWAAKHARAGKAQDDRADAELHQIKAEAAELVNGLPREMTDRAARDLGLIYGAEQEIRATGRSELSVARASLIRLRSQIETLDGFVDTADAAEDSQAAASALRAQTVEHLEAQIGALRVRDRVAAGGLDAKIEALRKMSAVTHNLSVSEAAAVQRQFYERAREIAGAVESHSQLAAMIEAIRHVARLKQLKVSEDALAAIKAQGNGRLTIEAGDDEPLELLFEQRDGALDFTKEDEGEGLNHAFYAMMLAHADVIIDGGLSGQMSGGRHLMISLLETGRAALADAGAEERRQSEQEEVQAAAKERNR